jgi:hypothetical protein
VIAFSYYTNGRPAGEASESPNMPFKNRSSEATDGEVTVSFAHRIVPPSEHGRNGEGAHALKRARGYGER